MFIEFAEHKEYIDQQLTPKQDADPLVGLLDTVRYLGEKHILLSLLACTLNDSSSLQKLATESYFHYNGFDRIVLLSSLKPEYKIRLHIWWPSEESLPMENVHNHRWDFATLLLFGSYQFEEYTLSAGGMPAYEYRFHSPEGRAYYAMDSVGQTSLRRVSMGQLPTGSSYSLSHDILHRVVSDRKQMTATLVVQGPIARNSVVTVCSFSRIDNADRIASIPFTGAIVAEKISKLMDLIRGEPSQ